MGHVKREPDWLVWQDTAACRDAPERDKAQFTTSFPKREQARILATRYCRKCPIVTACYAWAVSERYFSGIAGGTMFGSAKEATSRRQIIPVLPRSTDGVS